jgi:hypothetical protein
MFLAALEQNISESRHVPKDQSETNEIDSWVWIELKIGYKSICNVTKYLEVCEDVCRNRKRGPLKYISEGV